MELQELGSEERIVRSGERDLYPSIEDVRTSEGDEQCSLRPRHHPSRAVDDTPAASMDRGDGLQSQKGIDEIGTENLTMWFREEFEKANAQMMVERDEWALSQIDGTA